jgi:hypothetical protein
MGIATGTATRENYRELYFPPHERAMAHYSYPSPHRDWALVVQMDENGDWGACELISLNGSAPPRTIGPAGACRSAGWSPDGAWMYLSAFVNGKSHLGRQRFPNGQPEQITFGPTEEEGVAVVPDGRSIITSVGVHQSAIWLHDERGDRPISSEGEVVSGNSPPSMRPDGKLLYYLLRRQTNKDAELWRMDLESLVSEAVFPGVSMREYDISPNGRQVVYASETAASTQLWIAPVDKSSPARRIGATGERTPHFGPRGEIVFRFKDGNFNYLGRMNQDGSGRAKARNGPIAEIQGISPGRRWLIGVTPTADASGAHVVAIPLEGGPEQNLCVNFCVPVWSSNGEFLFVPVEEPTRNGPGRSLAIPVGAGETLPQFPAAGIPPQSDESLMPGAQSVPRADLVPGSDPEHYIYVNTTVHRNLYRISLP